LSIRDVFDVLSLLDIKQHDVNWYVLDQLEVLKILQCDATIIITDGTYELKFHYEVSGKLK